MDLAAKLRAFRPWNEQEARDRTALLRLLESGQAPYGRENPAHWTASAWVVSPDRKRVLMAYHNLYGSWAWLGGHSPRPSGRCGRKAAWRRSGPCPGSSTPWKS